MRKPPSKHTNAQPVNPVDSSSTSAASPNPTAIRILVQRDFTHFRMQDSDDNRRHVPSVLGYPVHIRVTLF